MKQTLKIFILLLMCTSCKETTKENLSACEKAARDPTDVLINATCLRSQDKHKEAFDLLHTAGTKETDPEKRETHFAHASYYAYGNTQERIFCYAYVLGYQPNLYYANKHLIDIFCELEKYDLAIQQIDKALQHVDPYYRSKLYNQKQEIINNWLDQLFSKEQISFLMSTDKKTYQLINESKLTFTKIDFFVDGRTFKPQGKKHLIDEFIPKKEFLFEKDELYLSYTTLSKEYAYKPINNISIKGWIQLQDEKIYIKLY